MIGFWYFRPPLNLLNDDVANFWECWLPVSVIVSPIHDEGDIGTRWSGGGGHEVMITSFEMRLYIIKLIWGKLSILSHLALTQFIEILLLALGVKSKYLSSYKTTVRHS